MPAPSGAELRGRARRGFHWVQEGARKEIGWGWCNPSILESESEFCPQSHEPEPVILPESKQTCQKM